MAGMRRASYKGRDISIGWTEIEPLSKAGKRFVASFTIDSDAGPAAGSQDIGYMAFSTSATAVMHALVQAKRAIDATGPSTSAQSARQPALPSSAPAVGAPRPAAH